MIPQENHARFLARKINKYIHTARRMLIEQDYKRGCTQEQIAGEYERYADELRPFVEADLARGTPPIFIPRNAARAYLAD